MVCKSLVFVSTLRCSAHAIGGLLMPAHPQILFLVMGCLSFACGVPEGRNNTQGQDPAFQHMVCLHVMITIGLAMHCADIECHDTHHYSLFQLYDTHKSAFFQFS